MKFFLEKDENFLEQGIFNFYNYTRFSDDQFAFPLGKGIRNTLENLSVFPNDTKFYLTDSVGGGAVVLVNNPNYNWKEDSLDSKNYFVSVFSDDLIELHKEGLIKGVEPCNERKWGIIEFQKMVDEYLTNNKKHFKSKPKEEIFNEFGDFLGFGWSDNPVTKKKELIVVKNPEYWFYRELKEDYDMDYDDCSLKEVELDYEEKSPKDYVLIPKYMTLTSKGINFVENLNRELKVDAVLKDKIDNLLQLGYFDTAVREMAVYIESQIKVFQKTSKYGHNLIDEHLETLKKNIGDNYKPALAVYRSELRMQNKFIRNDFMHNLRSITIAKTILILNRQNRVYEFFIEMKKSLSDI